MAPLGGRLHRGWMTSHDRNTHRDMNAPAVGDTGGGASREAEASDRKVVASDSSNDTEIVSRARGAQEERRDFEAGGMSRLYHRRGPAGGRT